MLRLLFIFLILYLFIKFFRKVFMVSRVVKKNRNAFNQYQKSNFYNDRFDRSETKKSNSFEDIEEADFIEIEETKKKES